MAMVKYSGGKVKAVTVCSEEDMKKQAKLYSNDKQVKKPNIKEDKED